MKNKERSLYSFLLALALLFGSGKQISGQEKVSLTAGVGYIEILNVGVRYQINNSQIGMSIGIWPFAIYWIDYKNSMSLSGDFYYHFGGQSEFSDLPVWYGRIGLDYFKVFWESSTDSNLESHLRIGRDIYFSRDFGMSLDAGAGFFVINGSDNSSFIPTLSASLFYRF